MTVCNCPHCDETFRVPDQANFAAGLPRDAYAECPWCNELFMMTAVLGKLPPMLKIKGGDGQPISLGSFAAASPIDADDFEHGDSDDEAFDPDATIADEQVGRETISDDTWQDAGSSEAMLGDMPTVVDEPTLDFEGVDQEGQDVSFDSDQDTIPADSFSAEQFSGEPISDDWNTSGDQLVADDDDELNLRPITERQSPTPMRVVQGNRPVKKKAASWKTAVGVVLGGALALPIADGLLVLAGRDSILGIFPSKSSSSTASNVRVNTPMPNTPPPMDMVKATGRTLDLSNTDLPTTTTEGEAETPRPSVDDMLDQASMSAEPVEVPKATYPEADPNLKIESGNESKTMSGGFGMPAEVPSPSSAPELEIAPEPVVAAEPKSPAMGMPNELRDVTEVTASPKLDTPQPEPEPEQVSEQVPEPAVPVVDAALASAIDEANEVLDEIDSMDPADPLRRKAFAVAYREIAEVAEAATGDADVTGELIARIKRSPDLIKTYNAAATNWLTYAGRTTSGILIIGKPSGDGDDRSIMVEPNQPISISGEPSLPDAGKVIALGRIIGDGANASVELVVAESL